MLLPLINNQSTMRPANRSLPILTVNRAFIGEFISAPPPCFAMGIIQESDRPSGLLALRPSESIPVEVLDKGLSFGHSMFGNDRLEVIHFAFHFYGFDTYNVLVNPNNRIVQRVVANMIDNEDYFFFVLNPEQSVTTFRSEVGQDALSELKANHRRIKLSTTSDHQYQQAVSAFAQNPDPNGIMLDWVCRDNVEYLDVNGDPIQLTPA